MRRAGKAAEEQLKAQTAIREIKRRMQLLDDEHKHTDAMIIRLGDEMSTLIGMLYSCTHICIEVSSLAGVNMCFIYRFCSSLVHALSQCVDLFPCTPGLVCETRNDGLLGNGHGVPVSFNGRWYLLEQDQFLSRLESQYTHTFHIYVIYIPYMFQSLLCSQDWNRDWKLEAFP
jgi:hypothetical protein